MNPAYSCSGLRLSTTSLKDGTPSRTELFIEPIDQFAAEMDAFSRCILQKTPGPTPGEVGLRDMRIDRTLRRSETVRTVCLSQHEQQRISVRAGASDFPWGADSVTR